jgi:hypothetical protein
MFPITVSFTVPDSQSLTALATALTALGITAPSPAPVAAKEPAAAPKPAATPAAAAGPATAPAAEAAAPEKTAAASSPAAASAEVDAQASTAATEPVTYDQVKPLILKINAAKGREAAAAALGKFGVTKGPDLKPEQYAPFVAHANEVLAA